MGTTLRPFPSFGSYVFGAVLVALALAGCGTEEGDAPNADGQQATDGVDTSDPTTDTAPTADTAPDTTVDPQHFPTSVIDVSEIAGVDPLAGGERTRAIVVADFDNDGKDDMYVGNPGDSSYVLLNTSTPGNPSFETAQVLSEGHISWTAAAADFDNDGDVDLMVGGGGNECTDVDQLWKNQLVETGALSFVDVRIDMGMTLTEYGHPADWDEIPTTGVRWVDMDLDGFLDLYVTHNISPRCGPAPGSMVEVNELWRNVNGERFERVTFKAGLGGTQGSTRHPTIIDYDNDGDPDIFDSNLYGKNVFYHNMMVETGEIVFGKVDLGETGANLAYPSRAFASCGADLNNDGLEDLVVLNRANRECIIPSEDDKGAATSTEELWGNYHAVYINNGNGGFDDQTLEAGLEVQVSNLANGVMGCQIGDLNADGVQDVFVGNGGPNGVGRDDLFLGSTESLAFTDVSRSIRNHSGEPEALRTHGSVVFDVDGDLVPELVVGNGGPEAIADVREPNRIFQFEWSHAAEFLKVRLVGDGVKVNRDAIGSRLELVFDLADGSTRSIHRSQRGANCFSAENGRSIYFGLGRGVSGADAGVPSLVRVTWPDGEVSEHPVQELNGNGELTITYGQ